MNRKNSGSERRMGIVAAVHPGELIVKIQQLSACTGCHAKDFCTTADCKDRRLAIQTHQAERYEVGQAVIVEGKNSIGRRAILLAFVTPLLLLLLALGIGQEILCWSETSSILLALATLCLYYLTLYACSHGLRRTLALEVHPLNPSDTYQR